MRKELVVIYDVPPTTPKHIQGVHNPGFYLQWFDKVHVTYWQKTGDSEQRPTNDNEGRTFYGYKEHYSSSYVAGVRYMVWIAKTLWRIIGSCPKDRDMILMPVIPIWAGIPALFVGKLRRKQVILRLEAEKISYTDIQEKLKGTFSAIRWGKIFLLKIVYYGTIPLYDAVLVLSEGMKREVGRFRPKKMHKVPIAVHLEPFFEVSRTPSPPKEKPVILYVGQVKSVKGIGVLLNAFEILQKERGVQAKLLLAGEMVDLFRAQLDEGVEVQGWVDHAKLPELYSQADVFVLPSLSEAWGMVLMEAMASGLPVVASDLSGPRDLVEDGKTGFFVEPGNAQVLAEKLALLLQDIGLRKAMGQAGRGRIQEYMKNVEERNKEFFARILEK